MALSVDATSSTTNVINQIGGETTVVSHTISGVDTVLIVSIASWNNGGVGTGCSSITYNGIAMTAIGNGIANGPFYTEQWVLINPASGTNNIIATVAGKTDKIGLGAISFNGASQVAAVDTYGSTIGTSGTVTATLTTTTAFEYLIDTVSHLSANNPSSRTGTLIYSDAAVGTSTVSQYILATSAGTNSLSWTYPDPGDDWAYSVVAVKQASGVVPASTTRATMMMMGV